MGSGFATGKPVLMIGLDAAEISLVRQWMDAGMLPNLRALRERGAFGPMRSTARWLVGSPWQSFFTSQTPVDHGMYHFLVWRPARMAHARPSKDWLPLQPFWRELAARGQRVIAIDVPQAYAPDAYDGIEVSGWATHEILDPPASSPPDLLSRITRQFGTAPFDPEVTHPLTVDQLREVRDQCINTARLVGDLGVDLMQNHPWDLSIVCFSSTHRGGHQLWDLSGLKGAATAEQRAELGNALRDVYIACDAAIGRVVQQAGADANIIMFSLHGMGPNASRADVLPEMLTRILADKSSSGESLRKARFTDRLRALIPNEFRSRIKSRLPFWLQDKLTLYWRTGDIDWSSTRAFAAFGDLDGYIRINLRGREAQGIVAPGDEYQTLCKQIIDGLKTFVDEDSGEPLVETVGMTDEIFPRGAQRDLIPDMIVHWTPGAASRHRRIVSPRYGVIPWPTPGRHPQGRGGNHRPAGFVLACGDAFEPGGNIERADILDLAPTVYELLDQPVPASFRGHSLLTPRSAG
ncbi:MAG TPA: alkaline phosphatase family protein [Gammaproteobacteria bacterium]|nr:alkaline phosphatase family protein [Gammaproteobacteria bacterium]